MKFENEEAKQKWMKDRENRTPEKPVTYGGSPEPTTKFDPTLVEPKATFDPPIEKARESNRAKLAEERLALEKEYLKSQAKVKPEYIGQLVTVSETLKAALALINEILEYQRKGFVAQGSTERKAPDPAPVLQ